MARQVRVEILGDARGLRGAFREAERSSHGFARGISRVGMVAATGFAALAAGAVATAGTAVKTAATFDKTMRQIAAVAKLPKSALSDLRKVALDMGAKTSFSASQASEAMLELAKGGMTAAQIKAGGLQHTLTLAAAGGLELGDAANMVIKSLGQFGLKVDRAGDAAAALAGGANASTASVQDLGDALSQVGPGARNAGLSLQETVAVLAAFSDNGIRGSDAGTSLKTMLTSLVPTTEKAKGAMADLGLKFVDAHGAILPITQIAQQLQDRLGKLSEAQRIAALQTIFGSDATRAATVLMQQGAGGLAKYIKATNDRQAAEQLAKSNTEGAAGAFERLQGAIETVQIRIGDALLPALASAATFIADKLLPAVSEFPRKVRDLIGPALAGLTRAVQRKFDEFKPNLEAFGREVQRKFDEFRPSLATFGRNLAAGVRRLAQPILDALATALRTGDYGPLGRQVANALMAILQAAGDLAGRIGGWLLDQFRKVDWIDVGKAVGRTAAPFGVGFVTTLLDGLVDAITKHPLDTVLAAAAVVPIGRFGGKLAEIVAKLPFLRIFAPLFRSLETLTGPINRALDKVAALFGTGFKEGFARQFPGVAKALRGFLDGIGLRVLYAGDRLRKAGTDMVAGLGHAIGSEIGLAVRNVGQLIRAIIRPFATAGGWLVRRGAELDAGLIRGINSMLGALGRTVGSLISNRVLAPFRPAASWLVRRGAEAIGGLVRGVSSVLGALTAGVRRVIGSITSPFRGAAGWLFGRGREVLQGLWNGMFAVWRKVQDWISRAVPDWIRRHKGPLSLDRKLLVPAGTAIMGGFLKGLKTGAAPAMSFLRGIVGDIWMAIAGPMPVGGAFGNVQDLAKAMVGAAWGPGEWPAFNALEMGEAGWNVYARNPSSGAFGLPQALPPSKLPPDAFSTDVMKAAFAQLQWMIGYIRDVYRTPTNAYRTWLSRQPHWYGEGGIFTRPSIIGVGERGPEAVIPLRRNRSASLTVNLHINTMVGGDRRQLADDLTPALRDALRTALRREGRAALAAGL